MSEPVLGQCVVDQLVLITLSGHVSSEAEEGGDVDSVHVLCVLHVAAQVKLGKNALPRLLLKTPRDVKTPADRTGCQSKPTRHFLTSASWN